MLVCKPTDWNPCQPNPCNGNPCSMDATTADAVCTCEARFSPPYCATCANGYHGTTCVKDLTCSPACQNGGSCNVTTGHLMFLREEIQLSWLVRCGLGPWKKFSVRLSRLFCFCAPC